MIKRSKRPAGYTIIELITVLGIIIMLIGLLAPALGKVRRHAKLVKQNAQFHSIETALELYKNEFGTYPDSDAADPAGTPYCGAMKLSEAMVGQDLLGVHPSTVFNITGLDSGGITDLYPEPFDPYTDADDLANLRSRRGPYLPTDNVTIHAVSHIYSVFAPFPATGGAEFGPTVICDEYPRTSSLMMPLLGQKAVGTIGMPVLYYRANTSKVMHDPTATLTDNIYNSLDNQALIDLGVPWSAALADVHPIETAGDPGPTGFYTMTLDESVSTTATSFARPKNPDSFILISAGYDGYYGTADDVFNFGK
jgi:type II secretory pathway pseudopilin PulG